MKRPNAGIGVGGEDSTSMAIKKFKDDKNALISGSIKSGQIVIGDGVGGPPRTSSLFSPIMRLTGHSSEILCSKFHPNGDFLVSAGFDQQLLFYNVYGEECTNFHHIPSAHSGAILDLKFSKEIHCEGAFIYTASTDKTVGVFDVETGIRIKRLKGHSGFVNGVDSCSTNDRLIVSGSDDCFIRLWDQRRRFSTHSLNNTYQVTAVSFGSNEDQVVSGGIDNKIKMWDIRKAKDAIEVLTGHGDTITSLSLSPISSSITPNGSTVSCFGNGSHVLSNSMDNTIRIWDVRPFIKGESRCVKIFKGHQHNFEKNLIKSCWSKDSRRVVSGSSDQNVYIWDTTFKTVDNNSSSMVNALPLYKLPGHRGSVNDVDLHFKQPIVLSGSSDKTMYLGELEP